LYSCESFQESTPGINDRGCGTPDPAVGVLP